MEGYGYFNQSATQARQTITSATSAVTLNPGDAKGAAFSVAMLLVLSALFLTILKRSGFKAMVAVGRG